MQRVLRSTDLGPRLLYANVPPALTVTVAGLTFSEGENSLQCICGIWHVRVRDDWLLDNCVCLGVKTYSIYSNVFTVGRLV